MTIVAQNPDHLLFDAKVVAPNKHKVDDLDKEDDEDDVNEETLCQSTHFSDRVFLPNIKERKIVL